LKQTVFLAEKESAKLILPNVIIELYPRQVKIEFNEKEAKKIKFFDGTYGKNRNFIYLIPKSEISLGENYTFLCYKKKTRIKKSFLIQCIEGNISPILVVITPGYFIYERIIVMNHIFAVEYIGRKKKYNVSFNGKIIISFSK